jgi:hypothetical protein
MRLTPAIHVHETHKVDFCCESPLLLKCFTRSLPVSAHLNLFFTTGGNLLLKKSFAVLGLALIAFFAVPAAANAAEYVPAGNIQVVGGANAAPGEAKTIQFTAGSFPNDTEVNVQVTGDPTASFGVFKAGTISAIYPVAADGSTSFKVVIPTNAHGTYTVTATGVQSGTVGTAAITVVTADSGSGTGTGADSADGGLAGTGYNAPMLLIWAASGVVLLGIALVVVLTIVRRQRANA